MGAPMVCIQGGAGAISSAARAVLAASAVTLAPAMPALRARKLRLDFLRVSSEDARTAWVREDWFLRLIYPPRLKQPPDKVGHGHARAAGTREPRSSTDLYCRMISPHRDIVMR